MDKWGYGKWVVDEVSGRMTIRDIQNHLASTLGTELSHEKISKVNDTVSEEILKWQERPLEAFYSVIYLDAIGQVLGI